jgi:flagellin
MSLGVLNNISAIYAQTYLNQTQASLQTVLQQLSSGSRINTGADDAAGLAVVDGLQANEAALTQSSQNATNGIGLLQTADGALAQVTNLLNRAVTLSTEAANGTLNANQLSSANQEYSNILSEINDIGSTTNFNGNQVFTNAQTDLFVSDGTASGANSYTDTVGTLTTASVGETENPNSLPVTAASLVDAGSSAAASTPVPGSEAYSVTAASDALSVGPLSIVVNGGSAITETISTGETLSELQQQLVNDSRLSSLGVTATLSNAGKTLTISGAVGTVTTLTTSGTVKDAGVAITPVAVAASGSVAVADTATLQLNGLRDTLSGTLTLQVGAGTAHSITIAAGTTGEKFAAAINADSTFAAENVTAAYDKLSGTITITGPAAGASNFTTTGTSLADASGNTQLAGVDFTQTGVSTLTQATAPQVLIAVTNAIADIALQRGIIGANINQLTAASNVASSEDVNLTAASSSIESTNYGQATSDLSKYEVLSQTGISALAQANTVQQEILKLLQ